MNAVLRVVCPHCNARAGDRCATSTGQPIYAGDSHQLRFHALQQTRADAGAR